MPVQDPSIPRYLLRFDTVSVHVAPDAPYLRAGASSTGTIYLSRVYPPNPTAHDPTPAVSGVTRHYVVDARIAVHAEAVRRKRNVGYAPTDPRAMREPLTSRTRLQFTASSSHPPPPVPVASDPVFPTEAAMPYLHHERSYHHPRIHLPFRHVSLPLTSSPSFHSSSNNSEAGFAQRTLKDARLPSRNPIAARIRGPKNAPFVFAAYELTAPCVARVGAPDLVASPAASLRLRREARAAVGARSPPGSPVTPGVSGLVQSSGQHNAQDTERTSTVSSPSSSSSLSSSSSPRQGQRDPLQDGRAPGERVLTAIPFEFEVPDEAPESVTFLEDNKSDCRIDVRVRLAAEITLRVVGPPGSTPTFVVLLANNIVKVLPRCQGATRTSQLRIQAPVLSSLSWDSSSSSSSPRSGDGTLPNRLVSEQHALALLERHNSGAGPTAGSASASSRGDVHGLSDDRGVVQLEMPAGSEGIRPSPTCRAPLAPQAAQATLTRARALGQLHVQSRASNCGRRKWFRSANVEHGESGAAVVTNVDVVGRVQRVSYGDGGEEVTVMEVGVGEALVVKVKVHVGNGHVVEDSEESLDAVEVGVAFVQTVSYGSARARCMRAVEGFGVVRRSTEDRLAARESDAAWEGEARVVLRPGRRHGMYPSMQAGPLGISHEVRAWVSGAEETESGVDGRFERSVNGTKSVCVRLTGSPPDGETYCAQNMAPAPRWCSWERADYACDEFVLENESGPGAEEGCGKKKAFGEEDVCVVCLESLNVMPVTRLEKCGHIAHQECMQLWLNTRPICPTCNAEVVDRNARHKEQISCCRRHVYEVTAFCMTHPYG